MIFILLLKNFISYCQKNLTKEIQNLNLQANLASINDIDDFAKQTKKQKKVFNDKLTNLNKKVTLNKTKHVLVQNGLKRLPEKVRLISPKGLTKGLINNYNIVKSEK